MTATEKLSFEFNALRKIVGILNDVNASGDDSIDLTTDDATQTSLTDPASRRLRRSEENVVFTAFFPKSVVSVSEAEQAAATVTPTNPLVMSYAKTGGVIGSATATSASVTSGTASPTPSIIDPSGSGGGGGDDDDSSTIAIVVSIVVVIAVCIAVYVDLLHSLSPLMMCDTVLDLLYLLSPFWSSRKVMTAS